MKKIFKDTKNSEIELVFTNGDQLKLCVDFDAVCRLEQNMGKSVYEIFKSGILKVEDQITILTICSLSGSKIEKEEAKRLIRNEHKNGGMASIAEIFAQIAVMAMGGPESPPLV